MSKSTGRLTSAKIQINKTLTEELILKLSHILQTEKDEYRTAKLIARDFLGVRVVNNKHVQIGFWVPGLKGGLLVNKQNQFKLELFTATENIDFRNLSREKSTEIQFKKVLIQLEAVDNFLIGILDNVKIGTKNNNGSFYWLKYTDDKNQEFIMRDPLVQSCPFGIYAPAEVYDIEQMLKNRSDMEYFKTWFKKKLPDGSVRTKDIGIILEIHPETATESGTLEALTNKYKVIAEKITSNIKNEIDNIYQNLTADELNFIGFDAIELTPEVPPVEREGIESPSGEFFEVVSEKDNQFKVKLKKPDISNWGYDTPLIGTAAVNPSILATGRPDEFLEFVETLHNMPDKPIQLAFDAVLGHADFQGARLLRTFDAVSPYPENLLYMNSKYFRGPNMYGRDINYAEPLVRAILLEMYQRKVDMGFDCIRVDGGQDFVKEIDEETQFRIQDDEFINEMVTIVQDINGLKRYLDMNVEDGRPWPNDLNWLYNATYSEHILERSLEFGDKVKQWGPLIFAHNVHGKFKWFQFKWDRFKDTFKDGSGWITGLSNHDNARYFYRLVKTKPGSTFQEGDSFDDFYNDEFGESYAEAVHNALDNGALSAVSLALLPGSPMFFLNALFHTPWLFFRDIDKKYGVKVVADEGSRFLTWYINDDIYNDPENFKKLKKLGFKKLKQLVSEPNNKKSTRFMDLLFEKNELIKTDPVMVMYLYDDPEELGVYETEKELNNKLQKLLNPVTKKDIEYSKLLESRIESDSFEAQRKINFARRMIKKSLIQLEKDKRLAKKATLYSIENQINKLNFLKNLLETNNEHSLILLLQDAAFRDEYNIKTWAKCKKLNKLAPAEMKIDGRLNKETLMRFALDFMKDARDVCIAEKYFQTVNQEKVKYNFDLRKFRCENNWLLENPTNDINLDFFGRKIIANGAKDLGAFFSDKGDTLNSNTIYYGWRTSPCKTKQVFVLANMEGKPLSSLPLNQFMPFKDTWEVVIKSPGIRYLPDQINKNYILKDLKNGEAFVLQRILN